MLSLCHFRKFWINAEPTKETSGEEKDGRAKQYIRHILYPKRVQAIISILSRNVY